LIASLLAYGTLRMPLALLELPLFVLLPNFYSQSLGMSLALIGGILFATRLVDAIADPAIGVLQDRMRQQIDFRRWIWLGLPVLALGFAALFLPPASASLLPWWLGIASILTYIAFSVVSIAYQAWGAGIGSSAADRARVTTTREAFGLVGVLGAAALLTPESVRWLVLLFVVLALGSAIALRFAPTEGLRVSPNYQPSSTGFFGAWSQVQTNGPFRWLLLVFMLNGIATAIPATLVLFFMADVLGVKGTDAALYLVVYFLSGAIGMPLWLALAKRFGLRNAWLLGISVAVIGFVWTLGLDQRDAHYFYFVCVATGLALGSDLAMPPALLATVIAQRGHQGQREGAYFGIWNLATKLNLALAAGVALPLLGVFGYTPGSGADPLPLSLTYAALPSALKLIAGMVLFIAPLPETHKTPSP
jgi:Na+/melibiose symporter-like transporter